jgi:chromosome segregation ATPase
VIDMGTVQDQRASSAGTGAPPRAHEHVELIERTHLERQVATLTEQLCAARVEGERLEGEVRTLRCSIERLMSQQDVIDAARAIVDAEYGQAGEEGAL